MSKKQLERQQKYLNFLKEVERITLEGGKVDMYRLAYQYGCANALIPMLKQKKMIKLVDKNKQLKLYVWNTISPNLFMVSQLLNENKEFFRKYYDQRVEEKEKATVIKVCPTKEIVYKEVEKVEKKEKKRTFSFLFGLIKFNY